MVGRALRRAERPAAGRCREAGERRRRTAADSGTTVGVVPFPANRSREALLARLDGLLTQSCTLGWVDNAGVCHSLEVKVRSGATEALLHELEAQRGKHVNDAAYFLLSGSARTVPAS